MCCTFFLFFALSGCLTLRGLSPDVIVKHPDSPMMIMEVKGSRIKVAIYDAQENKFIEYGWIDIGKCKCYTGWFFMKYDAQKFLIEENK